MRLLRFGKHSKEEDGEQLLLLNDSTLNSSSGALGSTRTPSVCTQAAASAASAAAPPAPLKVLNVLSQLARRLWSSGLSCSLLASLIFSFSGLFVKLTGGRVPVLEVCLVRSAISFGLTILLMKTARMQGPIFGQRSNMLLLCIRGCCGACSVTAWYVALFLLPLGDAIAIKLVGPAITALVARAVLKEPLGYRGAAGCMVSILGVVVLSRPPFLFGNEKWDRNHAIGTAASVLAALLSSCSSLTIRVISNNEPAAVIAMWFHTCTMCLTAIPLALGVPKKPVLLSSGDGALMFGVAATSFVAQLLSTHGLQLVVAAKATAMGFTQVFYSYLWGAIFFGDRITLLGLLGVALLLAGVLMITVRAPKGSSPQPAAAAAGAKQGALSTAAEAAAVALLGASRTASLAADAAAAAECPIVGGTGQRQPASLTASTLSRRASAKAATALGQAGWDADALVVPGSAAADAAVLITAAGSALALAQEATAAATIAAAEAEGGRVQDRNSNTAAVKRRGSLSAFMQVGLQSAMAKIVLGGAVGGDQLEADVQQQLARTAAAALGGELCPAATASDAALVHCSSLTSRISMASSGSLPYLGTANSSGCFGSPRPLQAQASSALDVTSSQIGVAVRVSDGADAAAGPASPRRLTRQVTDWLASTLLAVPITLDLQQQEQQMQQQQEHLPSRRMSLEALPSPGVLQRASLQETGE